MHTTADDPKKYRSEEETQEWEKRDPISRFRIYLESKKLWNDTKEEALEADIKQQIDEAVKYFESYSDYALDENFNHQFGTRVDSLEEQRAEFNKYAK